MKFINLISLIAVATIGHAAVQTYADDTHSFRQVITDDLGVDTESGDSFKNKANWEVNTNVSEVDDIDDALAFGWAARHLVAPHFEGANPVWCIGNFDVNAENYSDGKGHELNWNGGPIRHGEHADVFAAKLTFNLTESTFDWDQITKYNFVFVGKHITQPYECVYATTSMTGTNQVPGNDSSGNGNLIFDYSYATQSFGISLAVSGIAREQVIGARLYRGLKGQQGTPIADIAPGQWFISTGHNSCALMIDNITFPFQYMKDLAAGRLYVNLMTQQYPNGELRGHLKQMKLPMSLR